MSSFDDFMKKLNAESNILTPFLLKYWDAVRTDKFEDLLTELFNSEDINAVVNALKLKLLLIQSKNSSCCKININKFLTNIPESNISGTHDFILHSMLIQPSTNGAVLLENVFVKLLRSNDEDNKIILHQLEILNVVMEVSIMLNLCFIQSHDNENEVFNLIISLICSEEKDVQRKTLLDIVPKYITCTKKYDLFSSLWEKIKTSETVMFIILALEQFYLRDSCRSFDIFDEIGYWNILQNNLNSEDPMLKKQSIYLLKKSVEIIISQKNTQKYNYTKIRRENNSSTELSTDAWKNFFIICDVSNEKQLHLVEPALKLYDTLKYLDASWQVCVSKMLIRHPHSAIVKHAVYEILSLNWRSDVNTLVYGLNNVFLYDSISTNPITKLLSIYITKLDSEEFIQFINNFCDMQPNPIPFFNVCRTFEMMKDEPFNFNCLYTLISCSEKVPHLFLRKGIQHSLFNSFYIMIENQDLAREDVLEELIKFIYISYKNGYLSHKNIYARNILNNLIKSKITLFNFKLNKLLLLPEKYSIFLSFLLAEELFDFACFQTDKEIFWAYFKYDEDIEHKLKCLLLLCNIQKSVTHFDKNKSVFSTEDIQFVLEEILFICDNVEPKTVDTDFFTKILFLLDVILTYRGQNIFGIGIRSPFLEFLDKLQNKKKYIAHIMLTEKIIDLLPDELETLKLNLENSKQNYKQELRNVDNKSVLSRKILSSYYKAQLKLMKNWFTYKSLDKLVKKIIKYYDKGDIDVILIVLNTLNDMFQHLDNDIIKEIDHVDLLNLLRRLERDIFSLQSNELFRPSILKFIEITAKLKIFNNPSNEFIDKFYSKMFDTTQTISGIRYQILKINKLNLQHYELVESLLYAPILRKNQRIEFDTCNFISSEIAKKGVIFDEENPYAEAAKVISTAVYILLNNLSNGKDGSQFCTSIWIILRSKYSEITVERYYGDSFIHIRKLRILQCLHLLLPYMNTDLLNDAKKWLFESLVTESPQPSIKLLLQWMLVRIYIRLKNTSETIVHLLDKAKSLSGANLTYIFPIIYHLLKEIQGNSAIIEQCFELLLIFSMGQQFSIRYIAQITFKSIYEHCTLDTNIRNKYAIIYDTINEVIKQTKVQKSVDAIISFISLPLSIETIYYEIPRLTNVSHTKWLSIECFEFEDMPLIELRCNVSLKELQIKSLCSATPHNQTETGNSNVQRKIDTNSTNDFINDCKDSNAVTSGLVVVASLINRAPNLGGLNRTCEVFSVKEYVLNNIQHTKNKEYRSLSMSSENWTTITEIKINNLCSYLMLMKSRGYRIIGAEQTANSAKLDSYKFEKQTVLLLGNEKEGIPANLIHILDDCIEIPQFGQIRSLNVHVAGSLFIWEYAKQYCTQHLKLPAN